MSIRTSDFQIPDSRRHPFGYALFLALAVLACFKLFGVFVYDTNDDALMAALSYGYYGAPEGTLIYIHPLLGGLLAALQRAVPALPWYYLLELGMLLGALTAFCFLILDREGAFRLPALVLFVLFFVYAVLFRLQYTKIAGAAAAAGCLLLFHGCRRKKWLSGLSGGALALLGFCLRSDAFYMVLIPLSGVGAVCLLELFRKDKKAAVSLAGAFLLLFILCGGLTLAEKSSYSSDSWQSYRRYNALRTELLDYGFPDYEENRELYQSLSIGEEDLKLFQSWDFGDPEIFNEAAMTALCQAKAPRGVTVRGALGAVKEAVRGLLSYDFAGILLASAALALGLGSGKGRLQSLYALAALFATEALLLCLGRGLRERVDVPLMLTVMAIALTVGLEEAGPKDWTRRGAALLSAALVLSQVPGLIARKDDAMERYVGASHLHSAYQVLATDKSRLYLTRTDELPPDRMPGRQGGMGYLENIGTLGGWLTESPYVQARYARYRVENPFRDLTDREDVRLMSNDVSPVLGYIRRHYAQNAQAVPVRQVNGEYTVYRILTGEPTLPVLPAGDPTAVSWSLTAENGTVTGTMAVSGENSFAADIYIALTSEDGTRQLCLPLQTPQAGCTLQAGRYGAFTLDVSPGTYQVTLLLAGQALYTVEAGTVTL